MKLSNVIILIIFVALLAGAGVYFWQQGIVKDQRDALNAQMRDLERKNKETPAKNAATPPSATIPPAPGEDASTGYPITAVSGPFVHVDSPNGGERLCLNTNSTIRWTEGGIKTVSIFLEGPSFTYTIGSFPADSGASGSSASSVKWKVGDILDIGVLPAGTSYKIEIKSKDTGTNYSDTSDKVFSIAKCK